MRLRHEGSCQDALIIAVTGYGRTDDLRWCRTAGIDHHMLKHVDLDVLLSLLATVPVGVGQTVEDFAGVPEIRPSAALT